MAIRPLCKLICSAHCVNILTVMDKLQTCFSYDCLLMWPAKKLLTILWNVKVY
jgi:hypothetical protein